MKKALALIAAMAMCLALFAACGGGDTASSAAAPASSKPAASTAASTAAPASDAAEEEDEYYDNDFELINNTGYDLYEIYISPTGEESWGEDILASDEVFVSGGSVPLSSDYLYSEDVTWDIMAIDEEGDTMIFTDVDLGAATAVDLFWSDGDAYAEVTLA